MDFKFFKINSLVIGSLHYLALEDLEAHDLMICLSSRTTCLIVCFFQKEILFCIYVFSHPIFWTEREKHSFLLAIGKEIMYECHFSPGGTSVTCDRLNGTGFQAVNRDWVSTHICFSQE